MQQLEIGEEKTIAREEGSQVNHGNHNDGEGDDHNDGDGDDLGREGILLRGGLAGGNWRLVVWVESSILLIFQHHSQR